jgi:tRNA (cmo5U34)-methyltransferase
VSFDFTSSMNRWVVAEHALGYLAEASQIPHRTEGEAALLEQLPMDLNRVLDLGTGDGRLLGLVKALYPQVQAIAIDFSPTMLEAVRTRFAGDSTVEIVEHNLDVPLPDLGHFDAIVSSFAIHHCSHPRKHSLYAEIFTCLKPGGIFCNLEHVSSPTPKLHAQFLHKLGRTVETEDPSNQLLDVETQLGWLRDIGFHEVDCHWKWLEMALLAGIKPD